MKIIGTVTEMLGCIADQCTVNANGMYEQLPHERLRPCIRAIESEEQQSVEQNEKFNKHNINILLIPY
uniref:Uncharacterized protein n=1 Tax=Romanomermis culicivorax TaxID=13658 RepID=A0A915HM48_ROMCU